MSVPDDVEAYYSGPLVKYLKTLEVRVAGLEAQLAPRDPDEH